MFIYLVYDSQFTMETLLEFVFCMCFLYWAFPSFFSQGYSRFAKMVDVITTRMFDTLNRFSPNENHQTDSLASLNSLKRFSRDQKYRRVLTREAETKARDSQLFEIKENAPEVLLPKRRPFMGLSCLHCLSTNRDSLVNKTTERLALRNVLDVTPFQKKHDLLHKLFPHLMQALEVKKFDYPQVADLVFKDDRLKLAIEKAALEQFEDSGSSDEQFYQQLLDNHRARAKKLLYGMRSTLSDFLLRLASWVFYKLLPCFLSSVVVHPGQINMLKEASKSNIPLIFLPLHKSHLDYLLVTFILLNNDIKSPVVAAGDNLKIPFFGSLLRGLGAFFIKRRIDPIMGRKDHVYKAVLQTYMNECLRAGHNVEFYIEGGRTRTGKPCMPKYGILSVIVQAYLEGTIEDALLVPVSPNYEKLVDGNFIREQLGQPKQMESFSSAIKGIWHVLNSDYGMMRIGFNQPFSLGQLVKTFNTQLKLKASENHTSNSLRVIPSTNSLYGTDVVADENKALVECISKHIIYDSAQSTPIMSTNALAFLLLYKFRNGATLEKLADVLNELREELDYSQRDMGFSGDSVDVINYAVDMLGPAVVRKERMSGEDIIKPVAILPNVIELAYYANLLVTDYALDSIIAVSVGTLDTSSGSVNQQVLIDATLELCNIFQYEFVLCKPCQDLEQIIINAINELRDRKQIFTVEAETNYLSEKSRRIARHFDDEDVEERVPEVVYSITCDEKSMEYLKYLRRITMPLIEAYAVTAFVLHKLVGRSLMETELVATAIEEMKGQLVEGSISYQESVSVDAVKNALKLYQKWDIIDCHTQDRLRLYYLKENKDNSESVKELYRRISKYRHPLKCN